MLCCRRKVKAKQIEGSATICWGSERGGDYILLSFTNFNLIGLYIKTRKGGFNCIFIQIAYKRSILGGGKELLNCGALVPNVGFEISELLKDSLVQLLTSFC